MFVMPEQADHRSAGEQRCKEYFGLIR
jgi:hypothetical protein